MQIMFKLLSLTLAATSITSSTTQKPKARKLLGDDATGWMLVNTDGNGFKYYTHTNGDRGVYYGEGTVPHDIYSKGQIYKYDENETLTEYPTYYDKLPAEFTPVAHPISNQLQMFNASQSNITKLKICTMTMESYREVFIAS